MIARLLQEDASCLDDRLPSQLAQPTQAGDLMIGPDFRDLLTDPVYRVERDGNKQGLILVPLNAAALVEHEEYEGMESSLTMRASKSEPR